MSDGAICLMFVEFIVMLFVGIICHSVGENTGKKRIRNQAAKDGLGEWTSVFPDHEFRFYTPEEAMAIRKVKEEQEGF